MKKKLLQCVASRNVTGEILTSGSTGHHNTFENPDKVMPAASIVTRALK